MRDSLDVAAPGDCSSAIKPKIEHRPIFLPAIPFLVEPVGCLASTVARLQEARRHSQGLAELGYFLSQYVRLIAAGFSRLSIRNHMGIRSITVKMFIIHILPDQLFGVGALAHRGLSPFIGGLCGDHSPHHHHDPNETLPNFPIWVMVGTSTTDWSCSSQASPSSLSFVARSQLVLGLRLMALVASCVLVSVEYLYAPMEGMFRYREVQGSHVRDHVHKMSEFVASTATEPIRLGGGYTVALAPHFQGPRPKDRGSVGSTQVCRWPPGGVSGALRPPQSPQDSGGDVSDVPVATPQKSETARGKDKSLRTLLGKQVRRWPQKLSHPHPLFPFRGFLSLESLAQ